MRFHKQSGDTDRGCGARQYRNEFALTPGRRTLASRQLDRVRQCQRTAAHGDDSVRQRVLSGVRRSQSTRPRFAGQRRGSALDDHRGRLGARGAGQLRPRSTHAAGHGYPCRRGPVRRVQHLAHAQSRAVNNVCLRTANFHGAQKASQRALYRVMEFR